MTNMRTTYLKNPGSCFALSGWCRHNSPRHWKQEGRSLPGAVKPLSSTRPSSSSWWWERQRTLPYWQGTCRRPRFEELRKLSAGTLASPPWTWPLGALRAARTAPAVQGLRTKLRETCSLAQLECTLKYGTHQENNTKVILKTSFRKDY